MLDTIEMATALATYKSGSQNARVVTEHFVANHLYCPACGSGLKQTQNNSKARDFSCANCAENFELKAKSGKMGRTISNGAFQPLFDAVSANQNLNLLALEYKMPDYIIDNLSMIPRFIFTPDMIVARKPLSASARRAGWVGCNIHIANVPEMARIYFVKSKQIQPVEKILAQWQQIKNVAGGSTIEARGWLLDTLACVEKIGKERFGLEDVYAFAPKLAAKYPNNHHVKDKLRQQLQILRDKGVIEFMGQGQYRRIIA